MWSTHCLFYHNYSQISSKITNCGHQVSLGNVTLCLMDKHILLMECSLGSSLYYNVLKSLWLHIWSCHGQNSVFSTQNYSQISTKITNYGQHISLGNVTLCRKNMHTLLGWVFSNLPQANKYALKCLGQCMWSSDVVNIVSFQSKLLSKFRQNNQLWMKDQPGKCDTVS